MGYEWSVFLTQGDWISWSEEEAGGYWGFGLFAHKSQRLWLFSSCVGGTPGQEEHICRTGETCWLLKQLHSLISQILCRKQLVLTVHGRSSFTVSYISTYKCSQINPSYSGSSRLSQDFLGKLLGCNMGCSCPKHHRC